MYKLYCFFQEYLWIFLLSLPTRGAWIEIKIIWTCWNISAVAPHTGSVDWNHYGAAVCASHWMSLPTRGAWIEIFFHLQSISCYVVAPHTGSVDWNSRLRAAWAPLQVAPHTGSVDWNDSTIKSRSKLTSRSPHGERGLKFCGVLLCISVIKSLPTRGAWIEIKLGIRTYSETYVAPHTGSVDWNESWAG